MFIVQFFTEFLTHIVFVLGIIGTLVGLIIMFIPMISKYKIPVLTVSLIVLLAGAYLEGKLSNEKEWQIKVSNLETKLEEAEKKAKKVNTKIVTKLVTEEKIIKEKGDTVIQYIDREVTKYDSSCPIPNSVIISHNSAAKNKSIDEILTPNTVINTDDHNKAAINPNKILLPKK